MMKEKNKVAYSSISPIFSEIKLKIDKFEKFESDWDGYGAKPISKKVIELTKHNLEILDSFFKNKKLEIKLPWVSPCPNGNIQFEWNNGKKYLEIEFNEHGQYMVLVDENTENSINEFRYTSFEKTFEHLIWVLT